MRPTPLFRQWLVAVVLLALAACSPVGIESPEADGVYPDPPAIQLSYQQLPENIQVLLNGEDVTALFVFAADGAQANGVDLRPWLRDGANYLQLVNPDLGPRKFYYDISGPKVHILSLSEAEPTTLTGYLWDLSGVSQATLDGLALTLDQDSGFSTTIVPQDFYEFQAGDELGLTSTTSFARRDLPLESVITARLNPGGVGFLERQISAALAALDFAAIIGGLNPIFDEDASVASARVDATNMTVGTPQLSLQVDPDASDRLNLRVTVPDLRVDVRARGEILFADWSASGNVSADRVVFTAGVRITAAGEITVALQNVAVALQGFGFNINNFPGVLESLLDSTLREVLEDLVRDQLRDQVPQQLAALLRELPTAVTLPVADTEFQVAVLPEQFFTGAGGINLALGGSITASADPAIAPTLGFRFREGEAPVLDLVTADGQAYDLGAMISGNLLNQALLAAHESGLTRYTLYVGDGAGLPQEADPGAEIADDDQLRLQVAPISPAYVRLSATDPAPAELAVDDLPVRFELKAAGSDQWQLLFETRVNATAWFDIGVADNGFLTVSLYGAPRLEILAVDQGGALQLSPGLVENLIQSLVPETLPRLLQAVETVPVPLIDGFALRLKQVWVVDSETHLALAGDLVEDPSVTQ